MNNELRVLVVEDDQDQSALLKRHLEKSFNSVQVDQVTSLKSAIATLQGQCHDLVFSDLKITDSSGLDTVRGLVADAGDIPIVVLSGNSDEDLAVRALQLGAQDYLLKEEQSVRTVRRVVRYALERHVLQSTLKKQAFEDALTGAANRRRLQKDLKRTLTLLERGTREPAALLMLDLDNFKIVNDSLGHDRGDELLVSVYRATLSCARTSDVVARLGGDEFAVLLQEVSSLEHAVSVARRVLEKVDLCTRLFHPEVSASIGVTVTYGEDIDSLMRRADGAMYEAKQGGKSRVRARLAPTQGESCVVGSPRTDNNASEVSLNAQRRVPL